MLVQRLKSLSPSVSIQYKGNPLPSYSISSPSLRYQLGNRPLYVVSPLPGYLPSQLIKDAEFVRAQQDVLYLVKWKS
jgi:hypothetical protein